MGGAEEGAVIFAGGEETVESELRRTIWIGIWATGFKGEGGKERLDWSAFVIVIIGEFTVDKIVGVCVGGVGVYESEGVGEVRGVVALDFVASS